MALASRYGDDSDVGAVAILSTNDAPWDSTRLPYSAVTGIGSYFMFKLLVLKKYSKDAAVGAGTYAGNSASTPTAFAPYAPVVRRRFPQETL